MKWAFRVGRLAGIDLYIHATFFLLLAWYGYSAYRVYGDWSAAASEIGFILLLFAIIVLHELGHALAARRYGVKTHDITLLPIGGVARLERIPEEPGQELVIAIAGPAVNVVLAGLCWAWVAAIGAAIDPASALRIDSPLAARLMWVNLVLIAFNLLPAFPMDGGRVLRALLAMKMDYSRATQVAVAVGQGMALLFGLWAMFTPMPMLFLVALFVWIGASQEGSSVQIRAALDGVPVSRAMATDFHTLSPHDSLTRAVGYILEGFQEDYPVTDEGRLVGVLTRGNLMTALAQHGEETLISAVMEREFETAHPREMLPAAFMRLQTCDCHSLPVVRDGEVVGMLTMDNLGEFMAIQAALRSRYGENGSRPS